jgi:hypothetical protein
MCSSLGQATSHIEISHTLLSNPARQRADTVKQWRPTFIGKVTWGPWEKVQIPGPGPRMVSPCASQVGPQDLHLNKESEEGWLGGFQRKEPELLDQALLTHS